VRLLFGREAHPVALALTLAALSVALGWLIRPTSTVWQIVAAGYGAAVAVILTAAWLVDRREWTRAAMLASIGLWCYAFVVAAWVVASPTSAMLAGAWAVLAFGSYRLEVWGAEQTRRRTADV